MNDERFFDLAMKVIGGQSTDAERAELDALLARAPELKTEFARLQRDVCAAKATLPLLDAMQATAGELPAYARGRLQTKVRQALGRPVMQSKSDPSLAWGWRWVLGLAAAAAVVFLVVLPVFRSPGSPVIQLAMLDSTGGIRGENTNESALFREAWSSATLEAFTNHAALQDWESVSQLGVVRIVYDRAAAELRVSGNWRGRTIQRTFTVGPDFSASLESAKLFVAEQTRQ